MGASRLAVPAAAAPMVRKRVSPPTVTQVQPIVWPCQRHRILWGTDWPHPTGTPPSGKPTDVTPLLQIDDGRLLTQLPVWAPDAAIRHKILVDNPARLYGF